jgi:hypothetical protein
MDIVICFDFFLYPVAVYTVVFTVYKIIIKISFLQTDFVVLNTIIQSVECRQFYIARARQEFVNVNII